MRNEMKRKSPRQLHVFSKKYYIKSGSHGLKSLRIQLIISDYTTYMYYIILSKPKIVLGFPSGATDQNQIKRYHPTIIRKLKFHKNV